MGREWGLRVLTGWDVWIFKIGQRPLVCREVVLCLELLLKGSEIL